MFDGRTPQDLLAGGIYNALAVALYSGAFWPVSVALVAGVFGAVERGGRSAFRTAEAVRSPIASDAHDYNAPENQPPQPDTPEVVQTGLVGRAPSRRFATELAAKRRRH